MVIKKYRKKPVDVSAFYISNFSDEVISALEKFCEGNLEMEVKHGSYNKIFIRTLEGRYEVKPTNYMIRGIVGEFYPCQEEIFHKTYEEINDQA